MSESIYWYDIETTGTDPARDRVVQFAGIRTDHDLNILYESPVIYCRLVGDVIPAPEAVGITGISPKLLTSKGASELEFIKTVLREFEQPGTCVAGYNSLRFDDEFMRYTLYRNLFDPYAREWRNGNSRWDVIDLMRMAHALRPEGVVWPQDDENRVTFRLERLSAVNGIQHENAHDALADVHATIAIARKVQDKQPKLFSYLFNLRSKKNVLGQLYPLGKKPVLHVSSMYGRDCGCLAVVLPIASHPTNSNGVIVYDLSVDPGELIQGSVDEIHNKLFTQRNGQQRIALKTVHINRCPAIAPVSTLTDETIQRWSLDLSSAMHHVSELQKTAGIVEKIQDVYRKTEFATQDDPDLALYSGEFFNRHDRSLLEDIVDMDPGNISAQTWPFDDSRLPEMLFRFRARNYPESLSEDEKRRWQIHLTDIWSTQNVQDFQVRLDRLVEDVDSKHSSAALRDLGDWIRNWRRQFESAE